MDFDRLFFLESRDSFIIAGQYSTADLQNRNNSKDANEIRAEGGRGEGGGIFQMPFYLNKNKFHNKKWATKPIQMKIRNLIQF